MTPIATTTPSSSSKATSKLVLKSAKKSENNKQPTSVKTSSQTNNDKTVKNIHCQAILKSKHVLIEATNIETTKSNKKFSSPQLKTSQPVSKLIVNKKRIISTDICTLYDDNDHDEDSEIESTTKLKANVFLNQLSQKKSNKVSFQEATLVTQTRSRLTPPLKRFRKLRLVDTPQTPKTLIKKSNLLISQKINDGVTTTPAVEKNNKKNKLIVNSNKKKEPIQSNLIVDVIKSETIKSDMNKNELDLKSTTSPLNNEPKLVSEHVQTPKTSRRTPVSLLKAPVPTEINWNTSPFNPDTLMEIDEQKNGFDLNKNTFQSNRRLFEQNVTNFKSNMNKKLQFDDSDNEDSSSCCSSYIGESLNKKKLINNRSYSNDQEDIKCGTSISITSTSSLSSGIMSCDSHNFNHFGSYNLNQLSYSSNSLYKPISRFINQNSLSSNNLLCGSCSNGIHQSNCSHTSNNSIRSPKSPFQFNHLHANINPFTPTNSFNSINSKSSNSLTGLNDFIKKSDELSSSVKQNQFKRTFEHRSNEEHIEHEQINIQDENRSHENELQNSLPKNKRLALRQCLVSRYHEEFHEVCKLGSGEFGDVFKCINRLDGCTYAIKRSKKPIAGSALEIAAWKEVCAHAVLVKHNNIVQYYSAWAEADRMLIQNEYCNGGSLAEFIESLKLNYLTSPETFISNSQSSTSSGSIVSQSNNVMSEYDLKILLLHMAKGLAYMHSLNLVHLDIKPGNIFICRSPRRIHQEINSDSLSSQSSLSGGLVINEESGIESDELDEEIDDSTANNATNSKKSENGNKKSCQSRSIFSEVITYKIGDLGHVTSTLDPHVEEGDCRYLPNEILQEQYDYLAKADVFALALTVFVCGSLEELPKNGDEWHSIRQGNLKPLNQCSERFNKLLTLMISENPISRPSASSLIHHPYIVPDAGKSKSQLRKELNQEKFKNEVLKQKVKKYEQQLTKNDSNESNMKKNTNSSNVVNKFPRSLSSTLL